MKSTRNDLGSELLSQIEADGSKWQPRGREFEEAGKMPQDILEWIYDLKLFKLLVPEEFGGRPLPLPDILRIFDALSFIDGSLGWLVHIGAAGGFFAPSFRKEMAREIFSPREAVIAGSGFPAGHARRVEGGYEVRGRWFYASGAQYATTFTANAVCDGDFEEDGEEKIRAFAFLPSQVTVVHDWNAFGLKATASNTFVVDNVFVPEDRVFTVGDMIWPSDEPLYRLPFDILAVTTIASVSFGLVRRFFDLAEELPRWSGLADKEEAKTIVSHHRNLFYELADHAWSRIVEENWNETVQNTVIETIRHSVDQSVKTAQDVFSRLGMQPLKEDRDINRVYRDLQTASQHFYLRG